MLKITLILAIAITTTLLNSTVHACGKHPINTREPNKSIQQKPKINHYIDAAGREYKGIQLENGSYIEGIQENKSDTLEIQTISKDGNLTLKKKPLNKTTNKKIVSA
jgi:hypothetical protein